MANVVNTTVDRGSVVYADPIWEDSVLHFSAEATYKEGTILARKRTSADSYAGTPTGTGDRVTALSALPGHSLKVGTYTLTYGDVTAGAGPATLVDPDGFSQQINVTASGDQAFNQLGVKINIAGTGTAYDDNDTVEFVVAAGAGYVPFSPSGVNGAQFPVSVLTYEAYKSALGTLLCRALKGGVVAKERLIIHEDGDGDGITDAHIDHLQDNNIVVVSVRDLSVLDLNP